ncbi:MAG: Hpt domain-containing protein [Acidobacteria bacterium]|nr:Hpt domain-containing protein [Acidobacteriota bacterium]
MGNNISPVLDPGTITELRRARDECRTPLLIRQLVEIYRSNAPKRIEQLRSAIAGGDARMLAVGAHTLKTNCAMLGAAGMAAMCATLEEFGDHGTLDDAAAVLTQVESEFERVLAALAQLLTEEPE